MQGGRGVVSRTVEKAIGRADTHFMRRVESIPLWQLVGGALACCVLGRSAFVRGANVPVLALADLGFHELGHLLTYVFPDVVTAMMGSITQVAVPWGLAAYFFVARGDFFGERSASRGPVRRLRTRAST